MISQIGRNHRASTAARTSRSKVLAIVILLPVLLASSSDADRAHSLATKMLCSCGCGDVLSECSHTLCDAKATLKGEILSGILAGRTDIQILDEIINRHGSAVMLTPPFRGFDALLWIVPIAGGVLGLALLLFGRHRSRANRPDNS